VRTAPEPPREAGGWRIVALAETACTVHSTAAGGVAAAGTKRPIAFVLVSGSRRLAFTAQGDPVDPDRLVAQYPSLADVLTGG
jgi:hypothetical protein